METRRVCDAIRHNGDYPVGTITGMERHFSNVAV